ncbi:MBL fold metallo-hydrolase [Beduinella massiliensis]|uniref:MBL fold metallo-hydrolase n=1 Tax=Beduinella massiliensis TaxID=1852363 RepID=UPI0031F74B3D
MYDWHVLTIGHLSRNKFWAEQENTAYRRPLATCTLLSGHGENILVDPSLPAEAMKAALFDSAGLLPEQITKVYSTHFHFDHHVSPDAFVNARWYMAPGDLIYLRAHWDEYIKMWPMDSRAVMERCLPAPQELCEGVRLFAMPGHTEGLCALCYDAPEGRVIATGDAVMSKEFYGAGEPYFFGWNREAGELSIRALRGQYDVIIPGHGEAFWARAYEK